MTRYPLFCLDIPAIVLALGLGSTSQAMGLI
jgi:hypothetical protein